MNIDISKTNNNTLKFMKILCKSVNILSEKISHTPTIADNIENSYDEHVSTTVDDMERSHDELRKSRRKRKEFSFGDSFYTYLIENELFLTLKLFIPLMYCFRNKLLKLSMTLF